LVSAQQFGTAQEARAMLDRAIAALKSNEAAALSEFNDQDNKQFHDHDLYVFCFNMSDGKITAYSSTALLGVDIRTLTLKDDPIGQRAYDAVQNSSEGSASVAARLRPELAAPPRQSLLRHGSRSSVPSSRVARTSPASNGHRGRAPSACD